jgi:YggT family protein
LAGQLATGGGYQLLGALVITEVLINFVNLFTLVFYGLLLARVIMSWISPGPSGTFGVLIYDLTEPVLAPIRRVLPKSQVVDWSPLVAFFLLQFLSIALSSLA